MKNIKDCEFIRGEVPMTKFNIRNISLSHLQIEKGDRFLDIGGGTGSVSIEAALQGAEVSTVEFNEEACSLILENAKKFGVKINLISGKAPEALLNSEYGSVKFDKCFIGGSGGELKNIFEYLEEHLKKGGIICANFILIKNLNEFLELLPKYGYTEIEAHLIQTASMGKTGLFKSENPIYIVRACKKPDTELKEQD
ncbi:precorrin-6Y C5,15-methyltransferase (decarboxylating) subunit CbiT [Treponema sp. OMZ 799]|uniref:precorrin-6Y C5,15-methyltransferase (decarboxylating) subunit CbiT n=1 Tax=Treponema sp. OMZ 799 TaxID=2563668 RepID=UPI0020A51135|nr:precorrin-6Y C5,15-methyltransferase (decarboxylating) subunit CbiT [Treponema sp. OMZ 799]UTC78679.1 precorrin-6Y C5,15-methyltransferase (decarboxylating) subunit CbiT [Treponema sp. OMZ 799]